MAEKKRAPKSNVETPVVDTAETITFPLILPGTFSARLDSEPKDAEKFNYKFRVHIKNAKELQDAALRKVAIACGDRARKGKFPRIDGYVDVDVNGAFTETPEMRAARIKALPEAEYLATVKRLEAELEILRNR